jgi:hypothetical protein
VEGGKKIVVPQGGWQVFPHAREGTGDLVGFFLFWCVARTVLRGAGYIWL